MQSAQSSYRPEIDGVRAIAVLSVMLFHAGVPGLAGGFLGVDVFFVISGFLITGQIVTSAERGAFSFADFYMRRIRRIIPALAVASLLTLPLAVWLMLPDDLENYGQSLVATGVSANNILLYLTSDYFSLETLYKPLVHTWSLGVEEQYYLIVPILMALSIRFGRRRAAFAVLIAASLASFATALVLGSLDPGLHPKASAANFYLLPSRFWELGIGGLAMMLQPRLLTAAGARGRQGLAALGLGMTLAAVVLIGEDPGLPGWLTLLPTLGTALVLVFADATGVGVLLAAAPMRWLGLTSYSAYLYHQPVFAFVRIASLEEPGWMRMASTIPLALLLGWLSWRFVERPFRNHRTCSAWRVLAFSVSATLLSILAGIGLYLTSGLHARWPELAEGDPLFGARQNALFVDGPYRLNHKPFATPDRDRNVLVIGDSFGRDLVNMAWETHALDRFSMSYEYGNFCADPKVRNAVLSRSRDAAHAIIASRFKASEVPCLVDMVRTLRAQGVRNVVVLGTKNFGFNNNAVMQLPADRRYTWRVRPLDVVIADNRAARVALPADVYVDVLGLLDDGTGTVPVFTPDRKFISQDRRHLTRPGARFVGEKVFAQPQFDWTRPAR